MGRLRGSGPRGNAASSAAISSLVSTRSPAPAFSAACSALDAFGIANTGIARVRKLSVTWRDVARCVLAISASTMPLAPGNHRVLDRALLEVIEHLIAGDPALACNRQHLVEIISVEVGHAPG